MTRAFTPHDYQRDIIRFMQDTRRGACWCAMGGGKSVSTLTAILNLSTVEDVFPVLVLAPLRVARSTWPDEVGKWRHTSHLKVSVITGNPKQRELAASAKADIYTTNYENLEWLVAFYGDKWPFKVIVADELSRLKSYRTRQGSKRAKALARVAHLTPRFIGLTGTPAPNGLKDLWGQTWFLDRGERLGKTFSAFEARWFTKGWDGFSIQPMPHAQKEIEGKLADICLTVNGLPVDAPIVNNIYVDLPAAARKTYKELEDDMFSELDGFEIEAVHAAARTSKCLQAASGAIYVDDTGQWRELHDEKIRALESVIEEAAGMPVLVAYHFKSDLVRLQAAFKQGRALDKEPKTIADWNVGKIPVLFVHPASAGHGLNLQDGGNILAFFSLDWNLETYMQVIERIGPMRQKQAGYDRPVFVHHIVARNTVDEMVLDRLQSKRSVQEVLLEAMERRG